MSIFILYPFRLLTNTAFHSGGYSFVVCVCGIAYFCICSPVRSLTVDLSVAGEFLMSFPSVRKTIHTVLACGGAIFCDAFSFIRSPPKPSAACKTESTGARSVTRYIPKKRPLAISIAPFGHQSKSHALPSRPPCSAESPSEAPPSHQRGYMEA